MRRKAIYSRFEEVINILALINGRLIDGTGRQPVEKTTIVVNGNRITGVGPELSFPDEASVVDLKGFTIMPGLIDCHLHIGGFVIDDPDWQFSFLYFIPFLWDYFHNFSHRRKLAIQNGVTTIRSAGDLYPHIIQLRDKIESGKLTGPRIFAPGPIFTAPGGHPAGTIYKRNRYIVEHATRQVSDTRSAIEEVKRLAEGGVDCIKVVYSKTNPMDLSREVPQLELGVLEAIVDQAHSDNLRVMVHTGSANETRDTVSVGADSIEHGILPGADSIEFQNSVIMTMVEKGTYYVPTLAIAWAYRSMYPDLFSNSKKLLKKLHSQGVNVALGTDSGTPGVVIGKAVHKELELMVEAGLSPMDAIVASTKNAAENLGKGSQLGTIEEGKLADMIVVSKDPLEDITNTIGINLVIKDGKILVDRLDKSRCQQR